MNYIFIDVTEGIEKVGIVENGKLVEFYMDDENEDKLVGNIYRGRVANVLPGMEAAFVDIGEDKNAYLAAKAATPKGMKYIKGETKLSSLVKSGEEIIVQVLKEGSATKGAKVTTHITIPGRFIVLTPFSKKISISRKIHDAAESSRLKDIGNKMQIKDIGMIFRTNSQGVDEEILIDEYKYFVDVFEKIQKEKNFLPCPKLIYKEMDLSHKIIRDCFNSTVDRIIVNDEEKYKSLLSFKDIIFPSDEEKLCYDKDFNIKYEANITRDLNRALERKVNLKSGGYIVIDETEALTAIDINSGKFIGKKNLEDTSVKTNLEACEEIARQIRLRDISGIIIIDFIDMKEKEDTLKVLERLEECLALDRNKANIVDITKLGLVELTRRKIRNNLSSNFIFDCSTCNGKGKIIKFN